MNRYFLRYKNKCYSIDSINWFFAKKRRCDKFLQTARDKDSLSHGRKGGALSKISKHISRSTHFRYNIFANFETIEIKTKCERDDYFKSFLITYDLSSIFVVAGAATIIGLNLKPNHHNQVKLVQIIDGDRLYSRILNYCVILVR